MSSESRKETALFLKEHPEILTKEYQKYLEWCEQEGEEPDGRVFVAAMAEAGARELDNDAAMVREITTPEEIVRVMEEEAERLKDPETKAVRSDHLEQAVFDRLVRKMEEHYPHHPMIKFLKPQRGGEVK